VLAACWRSPSHAADPAPACPAFGDHDRSCPSASCSYPEGVCYCNDGPLSGGVATAVPATPAPHWVCGRKLGRSDGCPDDLAVGIACTNTPHECTQYQHDFEIENMYACGPVFECEQGAWVQHRNSCSEVP
jgi:hypothetical protein